MSKMDKYTAPRNIVQQTSTDVDDIPTADDQIKNIESWYEKNKKMIINGLIAVAAIVGGYIAYNNFYKAPKQKNANEAIYRAQIYFGMDSLNWALNGQGADLGFLKIIDKYGSTDAGNLAQYYAGVSYLKLGNPSKAIEHLKNFNGKGTLVETVAKGSLGDAYAEQNKMSEAASAYIDASSDDKNILFSPLYLERAAIAYQNLKKNEDAIKAFKKIKTDFPQSPQARNVEKYLARLGVYSIED